MQTPYTKLSPGWAVELDETLIVRGLRNAEAGIWLYRYLDGSGVGLHNCRGGGVGYLAGLWDTPRADMLYVAAAAMDELAARAPEVFDELITGNMLHRRELRQRFSDEVEAYIARKNRKKRHETPYFTR